VPDGPSHSQLADVPSFGVPSWQTVPVPDGSTNASCCCHMYSAICTKPFVAVDPTVHPAACRQVMVTADVAAENATLDTGFAVPSAVGLARNVSAMA